MKFNTLTRRAAAAGGATALAAGALVGLTVDSASADPVNGTYICSTTLGPLPVDLTTDVPALGALATTPFPAGFSVPAGAVTGGVTNHFVISDSVKQALDSVGTSKIDFTDFAGTLGSSKLPADLPDVAIGDLHQNPDTTWYFDANGNNLGFKMPAAGTYDVLAPSSFSFDATTAIGVVPVTCTSSATPGNYGHQITVVKNASKTKASCPNSPVKHGAKAILKAKVTAPNHAPTGKVAFFDGKKSIGTVKLKKGVATLTKSLSKGKHTITMKYKGDSYTKPSSGKITVTQK